MLAYLRRCWIALDILLNTLMGGDVETMSSRMGRKLRAGQRCLLCKLVCGLLDLRWKNHCVNNIMDKVR